MPIETITLELQNDERDIVRVMPFIRRKIFGFRWYILPFLSLACVVLGTLFTMYRVATMTTYQYYIPDSNGIAHLVTVKETLFQAVFVPLSVVALGIFYAVMVVRRVPAMVRRMIKLNPMFLQPFTMTISEEGIETKTNGEEAKYQWTFIKTCYEKLGGLIIVFQSNSFLFIPARKLTEENYVRVRKYFSEKVGITQD